SPLSRTVNVATVESKRGPRGASHSRTLEPGNGVRVSWLPWIIRPEPLPSAPRLLHSVLLGIGREMSKKTALWLLVLALILAACGGGGSTADSATGDTEGGEETSTEGSNEESSSEGSDDAQTLAEFFGWDASADQAAMEAQFRER